MGTFKVQLEDGSWVPMSVYTIAPDATDTGWVQIKATDPITWIRQIGKAVYLRMDGRVVPASTIAAGASADLVGVVVPVGQRPTASNPRGWIALDGYPSTCVVNGTTGIINVFNSTTGARTNINTSIVQWLLGA